jgi:hypothetical protein
MVDDVEVREEKGVGYVDGEREIFVVDLLNL